RPTLRVETAAPVVAQPALAAVPAPVVVTPQPVAAAPQPVVAKPVPAPAPPPAPARPADNAVTARGILLMILGLLGIGVLTMMLRTPSEEPNETDGELDEE